MAVSQKLVCVAVSPWSSSHSVLALVLPSLPPSIIKSYFLIPSILTCSFFLFLFTLWSLYNSLTILITAFNSSYLNEILLLSHLYHKRGIDLQWRGAMSSLCNAALSSPCPCLRGNMCSTAWWHFHHSVTSTTVSWQMSLSAKGCNPNNPSQTCSAENCGCVPFFQTY